MSILLDKGNESVLGLSPFLTPFSYLIILGQFFFPLYSHVYDTLSHLDDRESVDPGRGVYQMMHLIIPYLEPGHREEARLMSRDYL